MGWHFIKSWSSTQRYITLYSAEAELVAAVKATAEPIGLAQLVSKTTTNERKVIPGRVANADSLLVSDGQKSTMPPCHLDRQTAASSILRAVKHLRMKADKANIHDHHVLLLLSTPLPTLAVRRSHGTTLDQQLRLALVPPQARVRFLRHVTHIVVVQQHGRHKVDVAHPVF